MPTAEFLYQFADGKLDLIPAHREVYKAWLKGLKDGLYVMAAKRKTEPKTNPQLAYWYGVVIPTAKEALVEAGYNELGELKYGDLTVGMRTDADLVDALLKGLYRLHANTDEVRKAKMSVREMSELIDFAVMWIAENLGVVVPAPQEELTYAE